MKFEWKRDELYKYKDPGKVRVALEWLGIEKKYKGQKWFTKDINDKGAVYAGNGKWVFVTEYEITLDKKEYKPNYYTYSHVPVYILQLNANYKIDEVPDIIKDEYKVVIGETIGV
jgi:hypothetical protein